MEVVATGLGDRTMVTTSWSPLFSAPAGGSWAVMTPTVASSRGTLPLTDTVMLASSARVRASSSVRPITSGAALSPRKTRKVAAASATIRRTVATGMIRAAGPPLRRPGPTLLILIRAGLMASPVVLAESPEGILRPPSPLLSSQARESRLWFLPLLHRCPVLGGIIVPAHLCPDVRGGTDPDQQARPGVHPLIGNVIPASSQGSASPPSQPWERSPGGNLAGMQACRTHGAGRSPLHYCRQKAERQRASRT